ncbi:DUF262 domain-containing protein [Aeromonas caviae]
MSIGEIVFLLQDNEIYIPTLVKYGEDWSIAQKRAFIESLILGFPASSFICIIDERARFRVVDGVKRFKAIVDFINDEFTIYPRIEGEESLVGTPSTFSMLEDLLKRRLKIMTLSLSIHSFECSKYAGVFEKRLHADFEVLARRITIIDRYISFDSESYLEGLTLISGFNSYLMAKYPNKNISVKIQQNEKRIRLIVEAEDGVHIEADQVLDDFNKHLLRQLHGTNNPLKDNLTINFNNQNVVSNSFNISVSNVIEQANRKINDLIELLASEPQLVEQLRQAVSDSQSVSTPEDLKKSTFLDRVSSVLEQAKQKGSKLYNLAKSSKECADLIYKISEKIVQLSDMI